MYKLFQITEHGKNHFVGASIHKLNDFIDLELELLDSKYLLNQLKFWRKAIFNNSTLINVQKLMKYLFTLKDYRSYAKSDLKMLSDDLDKSGIKGIHSDMFSEFKPFYIQPKNNHYNPRWDCIYLHGKYMDLHLEPVLRILNDSISNISNKLSVTA